MRKRITVLLADAHWVVRSGLQAILSKSRGLAIVGEAVDGREAVAAARKLKPDLIVMEIALPLLNGLEAAWQIQRDGTGTRVLIFSALHEYFHIEQAVRAKVSGYLIKSTAAEKLPEAVRSCAAGMDVYSPVVEEYITRHKGTPGFAEAAPGGLTPREIEVLALMAAGLRLKEIALKLDVRYKTVDNINQSLMKRLGIKGTANLTRWAVRTGVTYDI